MFLDETNFEAMPYMIPHSEDAPEALQSLIDRTEIEVLRKVLGSALYNEFINGLFVDGNVDEPIPEDDIEQKWKDLRDGANYTIGVKTYRYDGVVNFLEPYIFQQWLVDNYDHLSVLGTNLSTVENGTMISPAKRIVRAYNKFSKFVGSKYEKCDTLYGFLNANPDTYPDWNFTCPGTKNEHNI